VAIQSRLTEATARPLPASAGSATAHWHQASINRDESPGPPHRLNARGNLSELPYSTAETQCQASLDRCREGTATKPEGVHAVTEDHAYTIGREVRWGRPSGRLQPEPAGC